MPTRRAMSAMARPSVIACCSLSITHGPGNQDQGVAAEDNAVGDGDRLHQPRRRSPIAVTFVATPCNDICRL
jgi:hypothetical protein